MGIVYQAWDGGTQRHVALKLLRGQSESPEARERFLREGQLAASLNHRNTVYVFRTEELEGRRVIVMELVWGGTLSDAVEKRGPLPPMQAVDAILQVVAGLEAAVKRGILHCDIKPSNCFVDASGTVKVGDFSLAVTSRTASSKGPEVVVEGGTPGFAAPEQIRGEPVDLRADVFSVGVTLYFLLTKERPFGGSNTEELWNRALTEPTPSPAALRRRMPPPLADIVCRCLAKEPAQRFQSYSDLREALLLFRGLWVDRPKYLELHIVSLVVTGNFMVLTLLAQFSEGQHDLVPLWFFLALSPLAAFHVIFLRSRQGAFRVRCFNLRLGRALRGPIAVARNRKPETPCADPYVPTPITRPLMVGPYEIIAGFTEATGTQETLLAFDPALRRQVWVRLRPQGSGAAFSNSVGRGTRLRLLTSERAYEGCWDAYGAVSDKALLAAARTPQPWRRVRGWLLWLSKELIAAAADRSLPARLEPDQVWISDSEVAVLLDFKAPGLPIASEPDALDSLVSPVDAQMFLKRVALVALEGRIVGSKEAARRGPEVPLPGHARRFLERLGGFKTMAEVTQFLEGHMDWHTEVSRIRRLGAGIPIGLAFVATLLPDPPDDVLVVMAVAFVAAIAIVVLTRSNFWTELALSRVVTCKGARPERWRHAVRTTLLLAPFFGLLVALKGHTPLLPHVLAGLILVGFLWTVVCPARALHDLLSGTWVIPDE